MTLPLEEKERYDPSNAVWWTKSGQRKKRLYNEYKIKMKIFSTKNEGIEPEKRDKWQVKFYDCFIYKSLVKVFFFFF